MVSYDNSVTVSMYKKCSQIQCALECKEHLNTKRNHNCDKIPSFEIDSALLNWTLNLTSLTGPCTEQFRTWDEFEAALSSSVWVILVIASYKSGTIFQMWHKIDMSTIPTCKKTNNKLQKLQFWDFIFILAIFISDGKMCINNNKQVVRLLHR